MSLTLLCMSSGQECPSYFTEGLKSLHPNITNQQVVKELIKSIPEMIEHCKVSDFGLCLFLFCLCFLSIEQQLLQGLLAHSFYQRLREAVVIKYQENSCNYCIAEFVCIIFLQLKGRKTFIIWIKQQLNYTDTVLEK